jgi:hypothetical protein
MSEASFTTELINQGMKAERECQKLQALLNQQMPDHSFIFAPEDDEIIILDNLYHEKLKRQREEIVEDDNEDDDDAPEVKSKQNSVFKRHEDDNDEDDEVEDLLQNDLLDAFDPTTWGIEPQSPWSQHTDNLLVPTTTELAIPNLYTPEGVGLFLLFCHLYIFIFYSKLQRCRPTTDPLATGRGVVVDWYASI